MALGWEEVAALVVPTTTEYEEVRFNQLHNAGDLNCNEVRLSMMNPVGGWAQYKPAALQKRGKFNKHYALQYVCKMLSQYGPFSAAVASSRGRILSGQVYALACQLLRMPILTYTLPPEISDATAIQFLSSEYGEFSYQSIPRQTWMQSHAQPSRRGTSSDLYRRYVIPNIEPGERILDYGCGKGVHVRALGRAGQPIYGWEPYPRSSTHVLDMAHYSTNQQRLIQTIKEDGLFDWVVCDAVINSVDSSQAEEDVCRAIRTLCKPGGRVAISGRLRCNHDAITTGRRRVTTASRRKTEFLDANGFSAVVGKGGGWTYQLFHSPEQAKELCARIGGGWNTPDKDRILAYWTDHSYTWQAIIARDDKPVTAADIESLRDEMKLPLPDNQQRPWAEETVEAVSDVRTP